jgi:AraC family transcriptional regulator, transcriptional activator of pobA
MDKLRKGLDSSNIQPDSAGKNMVAGIIPTFALYGEVEDPSDTDWVHCETVQARSRLHGYKIEPHRHDNLLQLLYLGSGEADLIIGGQSSRLMGPAVVILPPKVVHGYTFSIDVEGTVVTLFESRLGQIAGAAEEIRRSFRRVRVVLFRDHSDIAGAIASDVAALSTESSRRADGRLRAREISAGTLSSTCSPSKSMKRLCLGTASPARSSIAWTERYTRRQIARLSQNGAQVYKG